MFAATSLRAQTDDQINPDRPGIADGSMVIRRGAFQLEAGAEWDHQQHERALSTPVLIRYGMSDWMELRVESAGYQRSAATLPATDTAHGLAPLSIGVKIHFLEEDARSHRPSLGVIARLFPPSGSGAFRSRRVTGDVRLAADLDFSDRFSINPNAGVLFNGEGRFTAALAALTLQCNITKKANVFIDGGAQAPEQRGGATSLLLDAGAALIIGRHTQLDVSLGWGARGETPPNVMWSAGISRRF